MFLVWYNMVMVTNPLIHRVMKVKNKAKVFHSSGYARAQSGENFGAAGGMGESFKVRQTIEEKRKFVRGYNNAKIMNEAYAFERARSYIPRTGRSGGGAKGAAAKGGLQGAATTRGNIRGATEAAMSRAARGATQTTQTMRTASKPTVSVPRRKI